MKGIAALVVATGFVVAAQLAHAQPLARPQSFVYENPYMVFTAPIGWARAEAQGEIDDNRVLRITAPDGKLFIEVYPAFNIVGPANKYMDEFLLPFINRLKQQGRDPRVQTLEIQTPSYDTAAANFKIFKPMKGGPLTVDKFSSFECYGFARYGWLQKVCAFAVDEATLVDEKNGDAKERVRFLKSLRPNRGDNAVVWSPKTDKEPQ